MTKRTLKHYRFSKTFTWINRHLRSRRKPIKKNIQLPNDMRWSLIRNKLIGHSIFNYLKHNKIDH